MESFLNSFLQKFSNLQLSNDDNLTNSNNMEGKKPSLRISTPEELGDAIMNYKYKNIIFMVGAGISVAAGIPDFRSEDGLYNKLKGIGFETPEDFFTNHWFKDNRKTFYELISTYIPEKAEPTKVHQFMKFLDDRGLLRRIYTQNIDGLEAKAGIPKDKIIQVHGTMESFTCDACGNKWDSSSTSSKDETIPKCNRCDKIPRPDIVFFGEPVYLPQATQTKDFAACDLLIIMGTSLTVFPFASLINRVSPSTPRICINLNTITWGDNDRYLRNSTFKGDVQTICKKIMTYCKSI